MDTKCSRMMKNWNTIKLCVKKVVHGAAQCRLVKNGFAEESTIIAQAS
uniref:Uncharacterized protein n=1 Tax=Anguilla anguilla TaxID=7936 RepID=A0A0E9SYZ3_ANGAN